MGLNWIEDLVGQFYQAQGYVVIYDVDLPMPKTSSRTVSGHSDIDVLAIGDSEVVHVECQSCWVPEKAKEQKELKRLKDRFDVAQVLMRSNYPFLNRHAILNQFVTTGKPKRIKTNSPWIRLQTFCSENGIILIEVNAILKDFIRLLQKKYPRKDRVGKEPSLARFLLHMIQNGFVNESIEQDGIQDK